ncbi:hypothetical protein [Burkholderia plantarii]|uniref:hypothetical protein n=1 Tax=Burkholderia plantarii TaxID=41899 RepID=UPI001314FD78|nr:hypothetical protein [Burkholderia plantarii]GLZ19564.1 hypothetical protein Bpla01_30940 [Burkholderia plantarii]
MTRTVTVRGEATGIRATRSTRLVRSLMAPRAAARRDDGDDDANDDDAKSGYGPIGT